MVTTLLSNFVTNWTYLRCRSSSSNSRQTKLQYCTLKYRKLLTTFLFKLISIQLPSETSPSYPFPSAVYVVPIFVSISSTSKRRGNWRREEEEFGCCTPYEYLCELRLKIFQLIMHWGQGNLWSVIIISDLLVTLRSRSDGYLSTLFRMEFTSWTENKKNRIMAPCDILK